MLTSRSPGTRTAVVVPATSNITHFNVCDGSTFSSAASDSIVGVFGRVDLGERSPFLSGAGSGACGRAASVSAR